MTGTDVLRRPFAQVDVFSTSDDASMTGNPVAVVLDADGVSDDDMAELARWTNLSETTFVQAPTDDQASYRVRIFTPGGELPFAGHPTLGTAHAWSTHTGWDGGRLVQQCALGLVPLRQHQGMLWFAAPTATISAIPPDVVARLAAALGIDAAVVERAAVLDNGPVWHTLLLEDDDAVLAIQPDHHALASLPMVGVVGACAVGGPAAFEVRAFAASAGVPEDPVTGSLNAGIAQWLIAAGLAPPTYVAAQGARMGRAGRVHVDADEASGDIWIGGATVTVIAGDVTL